MDSLQIFPFLWDPKRQILFYFVNDPINVNECNRMEHVIFSSTRKIFLGERNYDNIKREPHKAVGPKANAEKTNCRTMFLSDTRTQRTS
jgi:hypothetical protein